MCDNNNTQSIADYLAQLLKDKKQLAAFPNVFLHLERLLDDGKTLFLQDLFTLFWLASVWRDFWPRFSFCLRSFWKGFDTPEFPEFFGKIRFFKICLLLENFVDSFQFGEFSFELDRDLVFCLRCFCQVFLKGVRNPQIPSIFYKTLGNHM